MATKYCYKCDTEKETTEFSKSSIAKDGLQQECKACNKISNARFRKTKPEYQKNYWTTEHGKKTRYKASQKFYHSDGGGIYYIKNLINGNIYIGQTSQFIRREIEWRAYLNNPHLRPRYINEFFRAELDQYGIKNFEWKRLESMPNATQKELRKRERFYISMFRKVGILYNKQHNGKRAE